MIKPNQFEALDEAILTFIKQFPGRTPANSLLLEEIAKKIRPFTLNPWRVVDRRTQALRKMGKIRFNRNRYWEVIG